MSSKINKFPSICKLIDLIDECDKTYSGKSFNGVKVYFGYIPVGLQKKPNIEKFFKNGGDDLILPRDNDTIVSILSDMSMSNIVIQDFRFNTHWIEEGKLRLFIFIDESDDFQTNIEWDFIDGLLNLGKKYNSMMG